MELIAPAAARFLRPVGFSPDGGYVYVHTFALTGTAHRESPLWDPVGLIRLPLLGGTPETVLSGWFSDLQFAPSRARVAFIRTERDRSASRVVVADPDLKRGRVIAELRGEMGFIGVPVWSADSHHVTVAVRDSRPGGDSSPIVIDTDTGATKRLPLCREIPFAVHIQAAPDGGWIVQGAGTGSGGQLWYVSADGLRCSHLTDDTMRWMLTGANADRNVLVAMGSQQVQNLWRARTGGGEALQRLTEGINTSDGDGGIAVLGDGSIVFTRNGSRTIGGAVHLWILDPAGNLRQLTDGDSHERQPAAPPDGHTIVYTKVEAGAPDDGGRLWTLDVDSGESRPLTSGGTPWNASFSADGRFVYYSHYADGVNGARMKRVPVNGGEPVDITPQENCNFLRVSPDGTMASCIQGGVLTLTSIAERRLLRTLKLQRRTGSMRWLPDSSGVSLLQHPEMTVTDVLILPAVKGELRRVAHLTGDVISNYVWMPDGAGFVCSRQADITDAYLLHLDSAAATASPRAK